MERRLRDIPGGLQGHAGTLQLAQLRKAQRHKHSKAERRAAESKPDTWLKSHSYATLLLKLSC